MSLCSPFRSQLPDFALTSASSRQALHGYAVPALRLTLALAPTVPPVIRMRMKTITAAALRIKRLCHYQPFDKPERLARMFTEGTIYFSRPRDFNDPWDCRPCFSKSGLKDPEHYERTVRWFVDCGRKNTSLPEAEHLRREQELRSNPKLVEWMIDQTTSEMEQAIPNQYRVYCLSTHPDSTLMWSHYADSCKGICLEFSAQNELFCRALQVEYVGGYPLFSVSATDDDANLQPLLTKSEVWAVNAD